MKAKHLILPIFLAATLTSCGRAATPFIYPGHGYAALNHENGAHIIRDGPTKIGETDSYIRHIRTTLDGWYAFFSDESSTYVYDPSETELERVDGQIAAVSNYGKSFVTAMGSNCTIHIGDEEIKVESVADLTLSPSGRLTGYSSYGDDFQFVIEGYTDEKLENRLKIVGGNFNPVAIPDSGSAIIFDRDTGDVYAFALPESGEYRLDELELVKIGTDARDFYVNDRADECIFQTENAIVYHRNGTAVELTLTDENGTEKLDSYGFFFITAKDSDRKVVSTFVGVPLYFAAGGSGDVMIGIIGENTLTKLDSGVSPYGVRGYTREIQQGVANGFIFYNKFRGDKSSSHFDLWRCGLRPGSTPEKFADDVLDYRITLAGHLYFSDRDQNLFFSRDSENPTLIESDVTIVGSYESIVYFTYNSGPRADLTHIWSSENGGKPKFVAEASSLNTADGFVWYESEIGGRKEFFVSTDGRKFEQVFY